jgi:uncharacterized FlaG/YvyC family protein
MENNLDLNNADKLDSFQDEEILEYSNINWKDPLAGAREAARKAKEAADRIANQAREAAKRAKEEADRITKKAKEQADAAKKNIEQTAKDAIKSTKDQVKDAGKNIKETSKKISDKVKLALKKVLGKAVLGMTYTAIRTNQYGIATRLYPAIASGSEIKASKFKTSFVPKSKLSYNDILKKWKENGGKEEKLNEAIRLGAKVRFNKNKSKLSFNANVYSNVSSVEGDLPEFNIDVTDTNITPDEKSAIMEETGSSDVPQEEKIKGWQKFLAFILNIFKKHKADEEVPYEEGSAEASAYSEDIASVDKDISRFNDIDSSGDIDIENNKKGDEGKILGMSKGTAIGVGIGVLVLLTVSGILLYKKYGKK